MKDAQNGRGRSPCPPWHAALGPRTASTAPLRCAAPWECATRGPRGGTCQPLGAAATEQVIRRSAAAARLLTLLDGMTPGARTTAGDSYAYDSLRNIRSKSDYESVYDLLPESASA